MGRKQKAGRWSAIFCAGHSSFRCFNTKPLKRPSEAKKKEEKEATEVRHKNLLAEVPKLLKLLGFCQPKGLQVETLYR